MPAWNSSTVPSPTTPTGSERRCVSHSRVSGAPAAANTESDTPSTTRTILPPSWISATAATPTDDHYLTARESPQPRGAAPTRPVDRRSSSRSAASPARDPARAREAVRAGELDRVGLGNCVVAVSSALVHSLRRWSCRPGTRLRPVRLHDLRHGQASLMLPAGVPLAVVSKRLRSLVGRDHLRHLLAPPGGRGAAGSRAGRRPGPAAPA